jgi:Uma2 family endonuclease
MTTATLVPPTTARPRRTWSIAERERLTDLGFIANPSEPELRFTLAQCDELEQHGFLNGGEIIPMSTPDELHNCGVTLTQEALQLAFGAGYYVRSQLSMKVGTDSMVIPDAAVVLGKARDYSQRPTTALLIVEISDSTYTFDITEKAELYATAGIADYWILDLNARRLVVLRDPAPLPDGGVGYRTHLFRYANESICPLALPTATVAVNDLLP